MALDRDKRKYTLSHETYGTDNGDFPQTCVTEDGEFGSEIFQSTCMVRECEDVVVRFDIFDLLFLCNIL